MAKFVLLLIVVATVASASSDALPPLQERGKALLFGSYVPVIPVGTDEGQGNWIRLTFLMLDGAAASSASELSMDPGHHSLNVRCDVGPRGSDQVEALSGTAEIDVEADVAYDVYGDPTQSHRYCFVGLAKRS